MTKHRAHTEFTSQLNKVFNKQIPRVQTTFPRTNEMKVLHDTSKSKKKTNVLERTKIYKLNQKNLKTNRIYDLIVYNFVNTSLNLHIFHL